MKKTIRNLAIIAGISLVGILPASAQGQGPSDGGAGSCATIVVDYFENLEATPLSSAEIDEMTFLREEEKLARDVYLSLAETWQLPIFSQIARAESQHMNRVLVLLELYGIQDPISDDSVGAFNNPDLQALYTMLVETGENSLIDALAVGATIEDLDLADIDEILALSENAPIGFVCENLAKGSRNHLRAFMAALRAQDGDYVPQYLDQETFDAILASDMERGLIYDENGDILASCGRSGSGRSGNSGGNGNGGNGNSGNGNTGNGGNGTSGNGGNGGGSGDCDGTGPNTP